MNNFNVGLPVIYLTLLQHSLSITNDGMENLLSTEHLCLE